MREREFDWSCGLWEPARVVENCCIDAPQTAIWNPETPNRPLAARSTIQRSWNHKKPRPRQFKKKTARSSGLDLTGDPQSINLPQSSHRILPTSFFRFFPLVSRGAKDALKTKGSSVGSMKKMYLWFFFTLVHGASDPNSPTVTSCSRSRPPLLRGQTSSTLTFTRYGSADTFPGVDCTLPSITTADL